MGDATGDPARRDGAGADRSIGQRLDDLESAIRGLRRAVAAPDQLPRDEIRCHRLVVLAEDGTERVVVGSEGATGHVTVYGRTGGSASTCVVIFASDPVHGDGASAGLALLDGGNAQAMLDVVAGRRASLWFDDHGE